MLPFVRWALIQIPYQALEVKWLRNQKGSCPWGVCHLLSVRAALEEIRVSPFSTHFSTLVYTCPRTKLTSRSFSLELILTQVFVFSWLAFLLFYFLICFQNLCGWFFYILIFLLSVVPKDIFGILILFPCTSVILPMSIILIRSFFYLNRLRKYLESAKIKS